MDAASSVPPLHCNGSLPSNETENGEDKSGVTIDSGDNPSHSKVESHLSGSIPIDDGVKLLKKCKKKTKLKKRVALDVSEMPSSSSSSPVSVGSLHRGFDVGCKRRNPRFLVRRNGGDVATIGLPLGMSFAAVIAQVLYRRDTTAERMSVDHVSSLCTLAVRESLTNVFGDKLDGLMRNFEQSFVSTLSTLRLIYDASTSNKGNKFNNVKIEDSTSGLTLNRGDCTKVVSREDDHLEAELLSRIQYQSNITEEIVENIPTESIGRDLALHGQSNHLVSLTPFSSGSVTYTSMISAFEKSVMEQSRSNDLKTLELSLTMKKLKMKESQLALNLDANNLGRSKLAMGISKASFKSEKFKNELEEHRYAELIKKCIDCLIAGLLIMSSSMLYGAYVYSYERITEATASCTPSAKESNSWWTPKSVASFNSRFQTLWCHVQVLGRMSFGVLMIFAIAYLLIQRSTTTTQTMPVTFILLLLGVACGYCGKLCVDTLGGSGSSWLLSWEILCLLHFLSIVRTSTLFSLLYGPVNAPQTTKGNMTIPYWVRQLSFYSTLLVFLPLSCGLMPFASLGQWKDHFLRKVREYLMDSIE